MAATTFIVNGCIVSIKGNNSIPIYMTYSHLSADNVDIFPTANIRKLLIGNSKVTLKFNDEVPLEVSLLLNSLRILENNALIEEKRQSKEMKDIIDGNGDDVEEYTEVNANARNEWVVLRFDLAKNNSMQYIKLLSPQHTCNLIMERCNVKKEYFLEVKPYSSGKLSKYNEFIAKLGVEGLRIYDKGDNKAIRIAYLQRIVNKFMKDRPVNIVSLMRVGVLSKASNPLIRSFNNDQIISMKNAMENFKYENNLGIAPNIFSKVVIHEDLTKSNVNSDSYEFSKITYQVPDIIRRTVVTSIIYGLIHNIRITYENMAHLARLRSELPNRDTNEDPIITPSLVM